MFNDTQEKKVQNKMKSNTRDWKTLLKKKPQLFYIQIRWVTKYSWDYLPQRLRFRLPLTNKKYVHWWSFLTVFLTFKPFIRKKTSWISISGFVLNWCCQVHLSQFFEYLLSSRYGLLAIATYSTFHSLSSINFPLSSKTWGLRCFPCNVPDP